MHARDGHFLTVSHSSQVLDVKNHVASTLERKQTTARKVYKRKDSKGRVQGVIRNKVKVVKAPKSKNVHLVSERSEKSDE